VADDSLIPARGISVQPSVRLLHRIRPPGLGTENRNRHLHRPPTRARRIPKPLGR
jgi:hypothetical protein